MTRTVRGSRSRFLRRQAVEIAPARFSHRALPGSLLSERGRCCRAARATATGALPSVVAPGVLEPFGLVCLGDALALARITAGGSR